MRFEKVKKNTVTTYLLYVYTYNYSTCTCTRTCSCTFEGKKDAGSYLDSIRFIIYQNKPKKSQLVYTYIHTVHVQHVVNARVQYTCTCRATKITVGPI
jgi:hypothetical protein